MNTRFRGYVTLIALFFSAFTSVATLQAAQESPKPDTLKVAARRLKSASKQIKDPELVKLVNKALKQVSAVTKPGNDLAPEYAETALSTVQKALAAIKQKKVEADHHSSHSGHSSLSHHKSCNARSEISEIESEVEECCDDIKQQLIDIVNFLHEKLPCDAMIPICTVPVVLNESGKYCVTCDLVYTGNGAAITVAADNVSINFHNHSLTLTNCGAQGVLAENVNEFTLENDIIENSTICTSETSAAVHLNNVNKATINNIYTKNTTKGVWIENSIDVLLQYSQFDSHEGEVEVVFPSPATLAGTGNGAGVWVANSKGVTIEYCTFVGADLEFAPDRTAFGLHIEATSENITVTNSTFTNLLGSIHALSVNGLLIDHCVAVASVNSSLNVAQFGSCDEGDEANDVIVRDSSFIYKGSVDGVDGLLFVGGSGCLLENLMVDTQSAELGEGQYFPAGIHVGISGCESYSNLFGRNCIIKGVNYIGLHLESSTNAVFEGCQITDGSTANVFINDYAISSGIKNSWISNSAGSGVYLNTALGGSNFVEDCQIFSNGAFGLIDSVPAMTENFFLHNNVYGNENGIFGNTDGSTMTFFNTACNNRVVDCNDVSPAQPPGSPAVSGSNICCSGAPG